MAHGLSGFRNAISVTDVIHDRIHQGTLFYANMLDQTVAAGNFIDMLIRVPTGGGAHLRWSASVGADALMTIYEAPTLSADGSSITPTNYNRRSSLTASTLIFSGPTVTAVGSPVLENVYIPGGSGFFTPGGSNTGFEELVLNHNTDYLARLTNISSFATVLQIQCTWYEPQGRVAVLDGG